MQIYLNPDLTEDQEALVKPFVKYLEYSSQGAAKLNDKVLATPPERVWKSLDAVGPMRWLYKKGVEVKRILKPARDAVIESYDRAYEYLSPFDYLTTYFDDDSSRVLRRMMRHNFKYYDEELVEERNLFSLKIDETIRWLMDKYYGDVMLNPNSQKFKDIVGRVTRHLGQNNFYTNDDFTCDLDFDEEIVNYMAERILYGLYEERVWEDPGTNRGQRRYESYGWGYRPRYNDNFRMNVWVLRDSDADEHVFEPHLIERAKDYVACAFLYSGTYLPRTKLVSVVRKGIGTKMPGEFNLASHVVSFLQKEDFIEKTGIVVNEDEVKQGARRMYGYLPGEEARKLIPDPYIGEIPELKGIFKSRIPREDFLVARLKCTREIEKAFKKHCDYPEYMFLDDHEQGAGIIPLNKETCDKHRFVQDEIHDSLIRHIKLTAAIRA